MKISQIVESQHQFFNTNTTKHVGFRIKQLKKVRQLLKENEDLLYEAIYKDFSKSKFETYLSELALIYHEINLLIKKTKSWSKKKRVSTGLANFPARSYIIPEPLGTTLVIGAWNYPYQLSLIPAITSLAAGNTVIIKPSELPDNTSKAMAEIINNNFNSNYFCVVEGGINETTELLDCKFDKIFFTGSTPVGKIIYEKAAKQLTPVTLELGGKSPTFVLEDANIKMSVKRIVWAKFLNAGQTCVAPDYILVHKNIEEQFLKELKDEINKQYIFFDGIPENYLQIINDKNFNRLVELIDKEKIYCGGETEKENRFISPTVLQNISFEDEIMKDEIFGPILPVISFSDLNEVIEKVKERPKPLSCYIYSRRRKNIKKILLEVSFGGGCVNESLMHLSNDKLPFGGVGSSGIGNYHGKTGFEAFSHYKSIMNKPLWIEPNIKYAPYSDLKLKLIKWFFE